MMFGVGINVDCKLFDLLVDGHALEDGVVLLQLKTVGVVPTVLARDVVALLALRAREGDLRADIRSLAGHVRVLFVESLLNSRGIRR